MISKISTNIKKRENSNDIFITPLNLAKTQINMINYNEDDIWLDPFKNNGSYYNQFPTNNKVWTEILDRKDFFDFNERVDIICSNPPYSMIDKILDKCINLNPRIISFLIGIGNFTTKRLEKMTNAGYGLTKIHYCKVFKWYGMSMIIQFEKNKENIVSFDRTIWRN